MSGDKQPWSKPQLIVLTRGTPEESVLTFCKGIHMPNLHPNSTLQSNCSQMLQSNCGSCQARSGS